MDGKQSAASVLQLEDLQDVSDTEVFLRRSSGLRDGVTRLVARGGAMAVHVAASFPLVLGGAAPTIVGQRGLRLGAPAELDVVVPISEVRDRLARMQRTGSTTFDVPTSRPSAPWTATLPLQASWRERDPVSDDVWRAVAGDVASDVRAALPQDPGQAMVFQAREALWSRHDDRLGGGAVSGAAFVAQAYGFLLPGGSSRRFTSATWERLSSRGGTLLWRV
jgi:hypothetical protein